jgi:hypothetical protein
MEGDPSIPVITDTWLKGLRDFDIETAYEAFVKSATTPGAHNRMRPDIDPYIEKGYVPLGLYSADSSGDNSVSHALEYYIADYALSLLAADLGHMEDAERFKAFSRNMFGCFVMGNAKVNGSGARWLLTDKLRNGVPAETVIRMVGEEAQFVEAEGWVIGPHGDFEDPSVTESSENAVEDKEARIRSFTQQFFGTDQESEGF